MSKLSAIVIIALFLGGGTGMGGVLIYQFTTGTLVRPEGPIMN